MKTSKSMCTLNLVLKQVLETDLFRVTPGGFKPSSCLSLAQPFESKTGTVPEGDAGETLLISDESRVVLGDNQQVPISSFYADRALKTHLLGRYLDRLPFVVRLCDAGSWHDSFRTFARHYDKYRQRLRELGFTAEGCGQIAYFSLGGCFASMYDRVAAVMDSIVAFNRDNPDVAEDGKLKAHCSRMREVHKELFMQVLPLRLHFISELQPASDAMLYVMRAEEGARLLLGWNGGSPSSRCRKIYVDQRPVRHHANITRAVEGFAHAIPPMFPFGMTGGVEALLITPRLKSFAVDDWGRSPPGSGWAALSVHVLKRYYERVRHMGFSDDQAQLEANHVTKDAFHRILEECVVPPSVLGIESDAGGMYSYNVLDGLPFSAFVFNQFINRFFRLQAGVDTFRLDSDNHVMVWVLINGAMSVTSPTGIELHLEKGGACLFPASATGDYKVEVHEQGAHCLSVSAPIVAS